MTSWYRVLVTGSRRWHDPNAVERELTRLLVEHKSLTVVHGDCPTGADRHARTWAEAQIHMGMRVSDAWVRHEAYPALWEEFDKAAGPIRNKYMVQLDADVCIAFPDFHSRGTVSCIRLAQAAGIRVINYGTMPKGEIL